MINIIIAAASRAITDRRGVTAAEYAVLATGIVVAVGLAATSFGSRISAVFAGIAL